MLDQNLSWYSGPLPLVEWTSAGLYCRKGGFAIDPHAGVETAIITHAHSDHAKRGSKNYIAEESGLGLLRVRLGKRISVRGVPYGKPFELGQVQVSFHPAGHILGSAQVRIDDGSQVWVVSGDYKRQWDPSCAPFEVVRCDVLITEATFGAPHYVWDPAVDSGQLIHQWWERNAQQGKASVLFGYSLGKTQRILALLEPIAKKPILIHDSMVELTQCYRDQGVRLAPTLPLSALPLEQPFSGELFIVPPSFVKTDWQKRLGAFESAFASGWVQDRGSGFVLSDHADWVALNQTILETGAKQVFVIHRGRKALIQHLRAQGIGADSVTRLALNSYQADQERTLSLFDSMRAPARTLR